LGEIELVSTNFFPTQNLRRLVEMAGEERDLFHVGDLGCEGKIPNLHVLGHSRAQCCHGKTPLRNGMCCKQRFHGFAKEHGKKQSARELQKRTLEGI
jgi:hypothetical protein